jgi:5'-3' exonuclease
VDGSGYIFRAYHALPPMTRPDGTPVNAVFGFTNMLSQFLLRHAASHIAVVFDAGRHTFRNQIYAALEGAARRTRRRSLRAAIRPDPTRPMQAFGDRAAWNRRATRRTI